MRWILAILVICLASCTDNKHDKVGKYVYVDCSNTIHIDRDCAANIADTPKTKEERMANMQGVEFIDTCNLIREWSTPLMKGSFNFCPKCVDDEAYKHLAEIMHRNAEYQARIKAHADSISERLTWLYNRLYVNYDLPNYDTFVRDMADPQKRQRTYQTANNEGLNVGATFDEFSELLGY